MASTSGTSSLGAGRGEGVEVDLDRPGSGRLDDHVDQHAGAGVDLGGVGQRQRGAGRLGVDQGGGHGQDGGGQEELDEDGLAEAGLPRPAGPSSGDAGRSRSVRAAIPFVVWFRPPPRVPVTARSGWTGDDSGGDLEVEGERRGRRRSSAG